MLLKNVRLTVEGCDFRSPYMWTSAFFHGSGSAWEFRNCRFLGGVGEPLDYDGPKLRMADCLIVFQESFGGGPWLSLRSKTLDWEMENCALYVGGVLRELFRPIDNSHWKLRWHHNTIITCGTFLESLEKRPAARIEIESVGNIFQLNNTNPNIYQGAQVHTWKDRVQWRGHHNLYVGSKDGLAWVHDAGSKQKTYGLSGWNELWGQEETGSREAEVFYPVFREPLALHEPAPLLAAVQASATRRLQGLPAEFSTAGPNWDLVGPGAAYVRALAAAGQPVAEGQLRPAAVEGAPFVLLRQGKIAQAFDQFHLALAAVRDGDILELRTDDAIPASGQPNSKTPMSLTIRAAPRYQPVIEGQARWLVPGVTLNVEGLHFRKGSVNLGGYEQTGKGCRLARLANCSFSADVLQGVGTFSLGDPWSAAQLQSNGVTEIVNCLAPGAADILGERGGHLVIRNSVLRSFNQWNRSGIGSEDHFIEIEHSLLLSPANFDSAFGGGDWQAKGPFSLPRITLRDSVVENPRSLLALGNPELKLAGWQGERNVFALGEGYWHTTYGANLPVVTNLGGWQTLWDSDKESAQIDPLIYDARSWKLLPGTPGHGQGPEGKDLGADVTRIGTTTPVTTR